MNDVRVALLALTVAIAGSAPGIGAQQAPDDAVREADVVVHVDGLSCPFCAYGVEKKFAEREEVDSVFVALADGKVHLWLAPGRALSDEAVRQTVEAAGFSARAVVRPTGEPGPG